MGNELGVEKNDIRKEIYYPYFKRLLIKNINVTGDIEGFNIGFKSGQLCPDDLIRAVLEEPTGFYKPLGIWGRIDEMRMHLSRFTNCEQYNFSAGLFTKIVKREELIILKHCNILEVLAQKCKILEEIDGAIFQNLDNIKEINIIYGDGLNNKQMQRIDKARRNGKSFAIYDGSKEDFNELILLSTKATYHGGELQDLKEKIFAECLKLVGFAVVPVRNERTISGELDEFEREARAGIAMFVDGVNECFEQQGVNLRFEYDEKPIIQGDNQ